MCGSLSLSPISVQTYTRSHLLMQHHNYVFNVASLDHPAVSSILTQACVCVRVCVHWTLQGVAWRRG